MRLFASSNVSSAFALIVSWTLTLIEANQKQKNAIVMASFVKDGGGGSCVVIFFNVVLIFFFFLFVFCQKVCSRENLYKKES